MLSKSPHQLWFHFFHCFTSVKHFSGFTFVVDVGFLLVFVFVIFVFLCLLLGFLVCSFCMFVFRGFLYAFFFIWFGFWGFFFLALEVQGGC